MQECPIGKILDWKVRRGRHVDEGAQVRVVRWVHELAQDADAAEVVPRFVKAAAAVGEYHVRPGPANLVRCRCIIAPAPLRIIQAEGGGILLSDDLGDGGLGQVMGRAQDACTKEVEETVHLGLY